MQKKFKMHKNDKKVRCRGCMQQAGGVKSEKRELGSGWVPVRVLGRFQETRTGLEGIYGVWTLIHTHSSLLFLSLPLLSSL